MPDRTPPTRAPGIAARRTCDTPIADYALLSNRQAAALVAHGRMDWLCMPRFDSPATFAALLGTDEHGYWSIVPRDATEDGRAYRDDSYVLDTRWSAPHGRATTSDTFASRRGAAEEYGVRLIREVVCTEGSVDIDVELVIRFDYGSALPWVRRRTDPDGEEVLHAIAGSDSVTLHGPRLEPSDHRHSGTFRLDEGDRLIWILTWLPSHVDVPTSPDPDEEVAHVIERWQYWRESVRIDGPYAQEVSDSLAVLLALTYRQTGGIVAAASTSLPEEIGGERNWDYRFTWLRDSALTIQVLAEYGHGTVAAHWRNWLLRAIAGDTADLQIMYALDGDRYLPEIILDHLPGYRGSAPVRIGNGAYTQYQADVIGEVLLALDHLREDGVDETRFSWDLQVRLLALLESRIDEPDQGIWEMRGEPRMFTHGRVMIWAAFDRGIRGVERHGLRGPVERWRELRDRVADEIREHGIRDGAFVQHYGSDAVDASLLQIPQTKFVAADDPVMLATVARVEEELMDEHGFVRRYVCDGKDGVSGGEAAFLMCTCWLAEQYARSGRIRDARTLLDRVLSVRNDLGLLAEEYEPSTGELLGNFPQAFSHLGLIRAAGAVGRAEQEQSDERGAIRRAEQEQSDERGAIGLAEQGKSD